MREPASPYRPRPPPSGRTSRSLLRWSPTSGHAVRRFDDRNPCHQLRLRFPGYGQMSPARCVPPRPVCSALSCEGGEGGGQVARGVCSAISSEPSRLLPGLALPSEASQGRRDRAAADHSATTSAVPAHEGPWTGTSGCVVARRTAPRLRRCSATRWVGAGVSSGDVDAVARCDGVVLIGQRRARCRRRRGRTLTSEGRASTLTSEGRANTLGSLLMAEQSGRPALPAA